MTPTIDELTPLEKTLMVTLAGRAADARKKNPLLGDELAVEVLNRLGPSGGTVKLSETIEIATAVRSKMLDRLVTTFITDHPDAVVIELGCGLETRMHRIAPPDSVDWYDVDLPDVIALRRQVIPELDRSHPVAASLTGKHWLDNIPSDRPVIAVADGVLGFFTEADNRQILRALTAHFTAGGELALVAYSRITARLMGSLGVLRSVGIDRSFRGYGFDDPRDLERLDPSLAFVEEQFGAQAPEASRLSWPVRILAKWFTRWKAQARRGVWVLRYRFPPRRACTNC
ncbi:class I SAM-dependent methyltransferase [Mycobacterium neumannii]|uniref:class I SAM-dependent methyltransferase n=1 Tax=Mycobacterium neumannii TaxID=2048551 RepID=UPI003AB29831